MNDTALLGPWVRRFLREHLIVERNLSRQTQLSYRDTLRLLLPFVAGQCHQSLDQLTVEQVSAERVRAFLQYVEEERQCTSATRNQRLAAIRALAGFVAEHSPEHIAWCGEIRRIPFKKTVQPGVPYLEKPEMDALLSAPKKRLPRSLRWRANASARTRFAIPQRSFSCVPAWTSTRSGPGSGTPRSTRPTSMPSSTWR